MEYPKIQTLFERDKETFKVNGVIKNPVYKIISLWDWTEKIDGTNIRLIWKDRKLSVGGRTDNASIPADLVQFLYQTTNTDYLKESFGDSAVTIYGEGYGAGIQKGGDYSPTKQFAIFDVLVDNQWWLNWENTKDIASKIGFPTVPFVGTWSLDNAILFTKVGFKSRIGTAWAEGLVGRTAEPLFDKRGNRLIIKLKTKDF